MFKQKQISAFYRRKGFAPLEFLKDSLGAKKSNQKPLTGFTLIELLVVIAIIGFLVSITMVSISSAQTRSRDVRRVADMKTIRDALAMYQIQHAAYPSVPVAATITGSDSMSLALTGDKLISSVPRDPLNTGLNVYTYQSLSNNSTYVIQFCLETNYIRGYFQGCGNQITP